VSGLPLEGKRILVTRPRAQAETLRTAIRDSGGEAILIPAIEIEEAADHAELDRAIGELERYDWLVFTSANAVEAFFDRVEILEAAEGSPKGRIAARARIAAIGTATAQALRERSAEVSAAPERFLSEAMAESLGNVAGMRVLVPGSDIARKKLGEELRARGAFVEEVAAYVTARTEIAPESLEELERGFDAVLFASPSAARNFAAMIGGPKRLGGALVVCIGPVTAEEARRLGYRVGLVAEAHSAEGLVEALIRHYGEAAAANATVPPQRS
jgi:uroporphyrinogen III methyltransferase/synthase